MHFDGNGLYLQVTGPNSRSWIYRYTFKGRERWLGLGSARDVSLAKARDARDDARAQIRSGIDPVQTRKNEASQAFALARNAVSFRQRAEQYVEAHKEGWRSAKHAGQWQSTLESYVYPAIGNLPANAITASHIVDVLRPIWSAKPETARRVRGRIEAILDYAADPDDAAYRNPATMTAQLAKKLPKVAAARRTTNHPSLPYSELGSFLDSLRAREGLAALALEFVILTAARTGEVIGAKWAEMNLAKAVWTVPAGRMKSGRPHHVPLSAAAMDVLRRARTLAVGDIVFPSLPHDRPLSNMALLTVLRRMGRSDLTVHGFRSTFRTWTAERTGFSREVCEAALAHVLKDKTEAAYQRGDLFDKRVDLMETWAKYCAISA
jgi:integrase